MRLHRIITRLTQVDMSYLNEDRFDEFIKPHMNYLKSFARHLTGDRTEAEDLLQKTTIRAMRKFDQYEQGTNVRAWMTRILKNLWIDEYRKRSRRSDREQTYSSFAEDFRKESQNKCCPDEAKKNMDVLLNQCLPDEVRNALLNIPSKYREVFVKYAVHDLKYEEIAEELDCPLGTVRSRISRARNLLGDELNGFARQSGFFRRPRSEESDSRNSCC